jgi:hypothetical protein
MVGAGWTIAVVMGTLFEPASGDGSERTQTPESRASQWDEVDRELEGSEPDNPQPVVTQPPVESTRAAASEQDTAGEQESPPPKRSLVGRVADHVVRAPSMIGRYATTARR